MNYENEQSEASGAENPFIQFDYTIAGRNDINDRTR